MTPDDWSAIGNDDQKQYTYHVYKSDGTYIGAWQDVIDSLEFTQSINTPGTSTTVRLGRSPNNRNEDRVQLSTQLGELLTTEDSIYLSATYYSNNSVGPGTDVEIDYRVDVFVQYGDFGRLLTEDSANLTTEAGDYLLNLSGYPNGIRVFSGYIIDYELLYGDTNGVTVTLVSNGAELSQQLVMSGLNTTVTYATQEISTTIKSILDTNPGRMGYTTASIVNTGETVPAVFPLNTKLEAIETLISQAPAGYYWYGNVAENAVYVQAAASTADHRLLVGYHIKSMALKRSQVQLKNRVFFVGSDSGGTAILKRYDDATSQTAWGIGLERITDRRYSVTASIDKRVAKVLARYKDPVYTTTITVSSAKYDIESLKLGQMVSVGNTDSFIQDLLLQIVSLSYSPNAATIQLGDVLDSQADIIDDLSDDLKNEQYQTLPIAPS